jgi:heat shock protein HtpX
MQNRPFTQTKAMDFREALAQNQRKTYYVMGIFIAIYITLGFFLDLYLHSGLIQDQTFVVFKKLIALEITPFATLTMSGVAILSILIAFAFYDRIMLLGTHYRQITPTTQMSEQDRRFYHIVEELKIAAGLRYFPKIFVIDAKYMNAFASGYSEKSAMIAVTQGLLDKLNRSELQAVVAHELSHIRHGDIKLILTASILSNLMLIAIDLLFYNLLFSRERDRRDNRLLFIIILLRYLLPVITVLLLLYLSRTREYLADAGCVELTRDNQPLGSALLKIDQDYRDHQKEYSAQRIQNEDVRRAAYIFDPTQAGIRTFQSINTAFSTHPPLKERLKALGFTSIQH